MKIKFKNGSIVEHKGRDSVVRGVRSNFITLPCYDTWTDKVVWATIDIRSDTKRFIPFYLSDYDLED